MDARSRLETGTLLSFPGLECRIRSFVGRGSNALVYLGEYEDRTSAGQVHEVLIKELFPLHPRGAIYRTPEGRIQVDPEGESLYAIHRESFERGNRLHLELLKKNPSMVGGNVNTFSLNGTLYTLLGCSGSIGLEEAMRAEGVTLRRIAERMLLLLDALEVFHGAGLLHLDVSPDNVLLIPQARREHLILIDYNSAGEIAEWQRGGERFCSVKPGFTAPEVCNREAAKVGVAADLYSVAAVFYWSLTGRALSLEECLRAQPPDAAGAPCMAEAPETVKHMVRRILRRGLNTLVSRRYGDAEAMRTDFRELIDRIDCVGVTHWALFETARRAADGLIRTNPSLAFLKQEGALYPLHFRGCGSGSDVHAFLKDCAEHPAVVLSAGGGQGKTTALLHAALTQNAAYSPRQPAAVYLSAYGYRPGDAWFVHDSLLRMLKFRRETETYAAARHELDGLLSKPLPGGGPVALILLDGFNEITGDSAPLVKELEELSRLPGVRIALSTRSTAALEGALTLTLEPLNDGEVAETLAARGILTPEDGDMRQALRTPLMLSLFIRATEAAGQQLRIASADELIDAVLEMETGRFPEDSDDRWRMDAAIRFVLPAIAAQEQRRGAALTEPELLKTVLRCYRSVKARDLIRFHPEWIGRRSAILGDADGGEEWYAVLVHGLLWRRAGLLIRDEDGFRVFHQQIRDRLTGLHRENRRRLLARKALRAGAAAAVLLAVGTAAWRTVWIPVVAPALERMTAEYYPGEAAAEIVEGAMGQCYAGRGAVETARTLLDCAENGETELFGMLYEDSLAGLEGQNPAFTAGHVLRCRELDAMEGDLRMPWSGSDFAVERYCALAALPGEISQRYSEALRVLNWLVQNEKWYARFAEDYIAAFRALVEADAALLDAYHTELLAAELTGMNESDSGLYWRLTNLFPYAPESTEGPGSAVLAEERALRLSALENSAAAERFRREEHERVGEE